jgi:DNA-binding winged helix-turn-helix (wHTH) protein/lipopolysaccharide biosynthesis regulator YciM
MAIREIYEFGEFALEVPERRLLQAGQSVPVTPKAYDLLVVLVRNAGNLVTKRQLLEQVWPESFVEEGILAVHVSSLRKILGHDDGSRRYIETVARSGYRFIGTVTARCEGPQKPARPERAYELFGIGRSHLLAASRFEVPKAVEAFRAAVELDPTYAEAYAGLALAHCAQAMTRLVPPAEAYSDAKTAALRALAMDPACADANVALGEVLFLAEWNWNGAERSLRRALQTNPDHTEAYLLLGQLLEALGNLDQGLAVKQKALERNPDSPLVRLQISMSYWHQRKFDKAVEWANKALDVDPNHPHAREHLAGVYWKNKDFDAYMAENIKQGEIHGVPRKQLDLLRRIYAAEGFAGLVKLQLERASHQPYAFPEIQSAMLYGEVGHLDKAYQHLERAIDERDPALVYLAVGPQWDVLRPDPRFKRCLARMGLTPLNS